MPVASRSSEREGRFDMRHTSQNVITNASADYHSLWGALLITSCDNVPMADLDKNGGPNHLQAWRIFRGLSQAELAERVGTNQNMIGYLEAGERGLSAKWLRRLAPALDTQPGMLLDHNPNELPADLIDIWATASTRERRQISDIVVAVVKTGTEG